MAGIIPNNVIRIPCNKNKFFRYWLELLTPFHHLTSREMDVATEFLIKRDELSKVILDANILNQTLLGEDTQREIKEKCGVANQHFQVIKNKLKVKKFFINGGVNPKLIPNTKEGQDSFQFVVLFEYNDL